MYSLYILLLGGDIQCQGTAKEPAVIYGNGINMIEIIVKAKIMDKIPVKIPVEMTKDDIKTYFIVIPSQIYIILAMNTVLL